MATPSTTNTTAPRGTLPCPTSACQKRHDVASCPVCHQLGFAIVGLTSCGSDDASHHEALNVVVTPTFFTSRLRARVCSRCAIDAALQEDNGAGSSDSDVDEAWPTVREMEGREMVSDSRRRGQLFDRRSLDLVRFQFFALGSETDSERDEDDESDGELTGEPSSLEPEEAAAYDDLCQAFTKLSVKTQAGVFHARDDPVEESGWSSDGCERNVEAFEEFCLALSKLSVSTRDGLNFNQVSERARELAVEECEENSGENSNGPWAEELVDYEEFRQTSELTSNTLSGINPNHFAERGEEDPSDAPNRESDGYESEELAAARAGKKPSAWPFPEPSDTQARSEFPRLCELAARLNWTFNPSRSPSPISDASSMMFPRLYQEEDKEPLDPEMIPLPLEREVSISQEESDE